MLFFCLFYLFLSICSFPIQSMKLCINCKYFLLNPSLKGYANPENGKCTLFPEKMEDNMNYLITGEVPPIADYKKCIIVRYTSDRCGKEGRYYEEF